MAPSVVRCSARKTSKSTRKRRLVSPTGVRTGSPTATAMRTAPGGIRKLRRSTVSSPNTGKPSVAASTDGSSTRSSRSCVQTSPLTTHVTAEKSIAKPLFAARRCGRCSRLLARRRSVLPRMTSFLRLWPPKSMRSSASQRRSEAERPSWTCLYRPTAPDARRALSRASPWSVANGAYGRSGSAATAAAAGPGIGRFRRRVSWSLASFSFVISTTDSWSSPMAQPWPPSRNLEQLVRSRHRISAFFRALRKSATAAHWAPRIA
mmetsp:Transcript_14774/g.52638  ORF Transcript_14774/g.52638 Transcript_14774/m.52638 type:complete len:263 (-) Transcript_14774:895-1683(-)